MSREIDYDQRNFQENMRIFVVTNALADDLATLGAMAYAGKFQTCRYRTGSIIASI